MKADDAAPASDCANCGIGSYARRNPGLVRPGRQTEEPGAGRGCGVTLPLVN